MLSALRTAPCFSVSSSLAECGSSQCSTLSRITANVHLDEHGWAQASLPVKFGGLGVRSAEVLAPACSTFGLVLQLLPSRMKDFIYPAFDGGMDVWTQGEHR